MYRAWWRRTRHKDETNGYRPDDIPYTLMEEVACIKDEKTWIEGVWAKDV